MRSVVVQDHGEVSIGTAMRCIETLSFKTYLLDYIDTYKINVEVELWGLIFCKPTKL